MPSARLREAGARGSGDPSPWASRDAELEAVGAVAELAVEIGARLTIAHVSCPEVAEVIVGARRRGADLAAEACPQYLLLAEDEVEEHGPLRKFTPPARNRSRVEMDTMWHLLADGTLTHVASDHAPSPKRRIGGDSGMPHSACPARHDGFVMYLPRRPGTGRRRQRIR